MTVPNILQQLGPNFDINGFREALESGAFKSNPALEAEAKQVLLHYQLQQIAPDAAAAAPDVVQTPQPGVQQAPSTTDDLLEVLKYVGGLGLNIMYPLATATPNTREMMKHIPLPGTGTNLGDIAEYGQEIGQQFAHDFTVGLLPEADVQGNESKKRVFNGLVAPATLIGAQVVQGYGITRALGYVTKVPAASTILEKIPERLREIGLGAEVGAGLGLLNPDANEQETRTKSVIVNAVGGAVIGQLISGISSGIQFSKTVMLAQSLKPADIPAIRDALKTAGVDLGEGAGRFSIANALVNNLEKVAQGPGLAKATGEILSKQKYIADEVFGGSPLSTDDQRLLAGIFRNNPSGMNAVNGLSEPDAIDKIVEQLGVNLRYVQIPRPEVKISFTQKTRNMLGKDILEQLRTNPGFVTETHPLIRDLKEFLRAANQQGADRETALRAAFESFAKKSYPVSVLDPEATTKSTFDVLIGRPSYIYGKAEDAGRLQQKISSSLKSASASFSKDVKSPLGADSYLLPDGTPIRAGFDEGPIVRRLKLQTPAINGKIDINRALQDQGQFIRLTVGGSKDVPELIVGLPRNISQEQFNALGRSVDALKFEKVTLNFADGAPVVINKPMGAQVQDEIAKVIKPSAVKNPFTDEVVNQFKRDGVFSGQAVVLEDGSPAMILRKVGKQYEIFDPVVAKKVMVDANRVTVLPTSLSNEFQPSNMFLNSLDDEEVAALFKLRYGISKGMANPVMDYEHLRGFANSRGFYTTKMKGGKIRLESVSDGESLTFKDVESAVAHIRQQKAAMPEVTPPEMRKWLGLDSNLGMVGGQGTPPMFGELIPPRTDVLFEEMANRINGRGQGIFSNMVPTRGLFADLDKKSGGQTELLRHFENLQQAIVAKHNFEAAWFDGSAPGLPKGVKPLREIFKLAGRDPDEEGITAFMEQLDDLAAKGGAGLDEGHKQAAAELRKWYDAMFSRFGIEAEYQFKYVPHWRETGGKFGNQPKDIWVGMGNDARNLPKAAEFAADHYRDGTLDIYDTHAFRVATNWLKVGSNNRFFKQAWEDAKAYAVLLDSDPRTKAYAEPFKAFLLALKGGEFGYQKKMVGETLKTVLDNLPGAGVVDEEGIDRLTNYLLGVTYSSVISFRVGQALRNSIQPLVMTWPIVGGGKQGFWEAVGRAMTEEGRAQAILDKAIDLKGTSIAHYDEALSALPKFLQSANNKGMYMYDRADQFTRSVSYWAGRLRAEKALKEFAEAARKPGLSEEAAKKLKDKLILDSGMGIHEASVVREYLRRASFDPQSAAGFAGKQLSDVTNFLYGRGMQARWMRSIPGRFLGQFGSWSMWYIDYLRRVSTNLVQNGYKLEAARFLGRHAIVNAAILAAGYKVLNLDLSRWVAYGSMFYSGGPAVQLAAGASTLARGLGSKATFSDDKLADARVTEGSNMIGQLLPNAVPFYFAGRDAIRIARAQDATELAAGILGTQTTQQYKQDRAMRIIMGDDGTDSFHTTSPDLTDMLNSLSNGGQDPRVLSLDQIAAALQTGAAQGQMQQAPASAGTGAPAGTGQASPGALGGVAPVKQGLAQPTQLPNEVVKPAESPPIRNY